MKRRILANDIKNDSRKLKREKDRIIQLMRELQIELDEASKETFEELELGQLYEELLYCIRQSVGR